MILKLLLTACFAAIGGATVLTVAYSYFPTAATSSTAPAKTIPEVSDDLGSPTPVIYSPMDTCRDLKEADDQELCRRIVLDLDIDEPAFLKKFEYVRRNFDLDRDSQSDVIVMVKSIHGSSGYPLLIYKTTDNGFSLLYEGSAWPPVVSMHESSNGWKKVAFLRQGGGVEPHFVTLGYSSKEKKYIDAETADDEPKGEVLFSGNWQNSFYGPIPHDQ